MPRLRGPFLLVVLGFLTSASSCGRARASASAWGGSSVPPTATTTPAAESATYPWGNGTPRRPPQSAWAAWAGPLVWTREPLRCSPTKANASGAAAKGWRTLTRGTASSLLALSVAATDANDVWIVGTNGTILHTPDHGRTFDHCRIDSDEALGSVWAASKDDVWILGEEHVFRVENRTTLAKLSVKLEPHCGSPRNTIFGRAPDDVWLASGALLRTKDGGLTWTLVRACNDQLEDACASEIGGNSTELLTDCPFGAARSGDVGATWSWTGWPPTVEEQMHVAVSDDDIWVVGQSSKVIGRSVDHGAAWTTESLGAGPVGRSIWSVGTFGHGWAWVIADGVWTRRGRLPWVRDFPPDMIDALGGRNEKDIWAVGANGLVLHRP